MESGCTSYTMDGPSGPQRRRKGWPAELLIMLYTHAFRVDCDKLLVQPVSEPIFHCSLVGLCKVQPPPAPPQRRRPCSTRKKRRRTSIRYLVRRRFVEERTPACNQTSDRLIYLCPVWMASMPQETAGGGLGVK